MVCECVCMSCGGRVSCGCVCACMGGRMGDLDLRPVDLTPPSPPSRRSVAVLAPAGPRPPDAPSHNREDR